MICKNCGSKQIENDTTKGNSYCTNCGFIIEENHIVSDITFDNTQLIGTFVTDHQAGASYLRNKHGNFICDSRQHRINKAYQEIMSIANILSK